MTALDFLETMKVVLPNEKIDAQYPRVCFRGLNISLDGVYARIFGEISLKFLTELGEKYPCKNIGIYAGPIGENFNPTAWADGKSYLDKCKVDNKEALVIFMCEYADYLSKKCDKGKYISMIDTYITSINENIIDRIDPRISIRSWMNQGLNYVKFNEGIARTRSNPMLLEFRRALDEFDRTINPFMEGDMSTHQVVSKLKGVNISSYPFDYAPEYSNEYGLYSIYLYDRVADSKVCFQRTPAGFSYYSVIKLAEQEFVMADHHFSSSIGEENGEIFSIHYFGQNVRKEQKIEFNISSGTYKGLDGRTVPISANSLALLYSGLNKIIKMSSNITVNKFEEEKTIQLNGE